jgi:RNA polymerase sigma-70 factor (ECF subfamily)
MAAEELSVMVSMPGRRSEERVPLEELVRRARSGDLLAFEALYRRQVGRVHALCRRVSGDAARAEELVQETFLRAWRKLGTLRREEDLPAWLHRVALNVALGERRSRSRGPDRERPLDEERASEPRSPGSGPGLGLDLERALDTLPPGARSVFVLHDVEGYRHEEIAGLLKVSVGTSKAQLHRARRLLRKALSS